MNLAEIRKQIDQIDTQILRLIKERMTLAILTNKLKPQIQDRQRELEIESRLQNLSNEIVPPEFVQQIYATIFAQSRLVQQKKHAVIAFQGERGAYSELAIKYWQSDLIAIPCREFAEICEGIQSGIYDFGIVPLENSLAGSVGLVNDLLISSHLYIVGAVEIPISHCLLSVPGSDFNQVRSVYSHPQALAQCRHFLQRHGLEPIPYYDTAGAARMVAEKGIKSNAAIASSLTAQLYNLVIIKERIEDFPTNATRFLILAREPGEGGEKCSLLFATPHRAGTLFKVLEVFAREQINLTRIESVPRPPRDYVFFLDFIGSDREERVARALRALTDLTTEYRLLGCYRERTIT